MSVPASTRTRRMYTCIIRNSLGHWNVLVVIIVCVVDIAVHSQVSFIG